jgi:hypothetical protein
LRRTGIGPSGYDPLVLFKCLLVGQWHGLSDPKRERALKVRLDFMQFAGLDLHGTVPDETCGRVKPLVIAMRTASRRNSSVYLVAIPYLLNCKHCSKETGTKPRQD